MIQHSARKVPVIAQLVQTIRNATQNVNSERINIMIRKRRAATMAIMIALICLLLMINHEVPQYKYVLIDSLRIILEPSGRNYYDRAQLYSDEADVLRGQQSAAFDNKLYLLHEKALADLNVALKKDPSNYNYYFSRACVWKGLDERQLALADYNRCLKINANATPCHLARGIVYASLDDDTKAMEDFAHIVDLSSVIPVIWVGKAYSCRGDILSRQNNMDEAIDNFEKAIIYYLKGDQNLMAARVYVKIGNLLLARGDEDNAYKKFEMACKYGDKLYCNMR